MKKLFAISLALIMLIGLLPVIGMAADEDALDMSAPTKQYASSDTTPVKFAVTGNTATLDGSMNRAQTNYAAVNYNEIFSSATNQDEYVSQTINIETMPVFNKPAFQSMTYASGYFNVLTRNYATAKAQPLPSGKTAANCHDMIMYSIYCKDEEGNLGMQIYYMHPNADGRKTITVENFAEKIGEAFTLTTVWHADDKVTFVCDGETLGTFDNVTFAQARTVDLKQTLVLGYNAMGTAITGENPVKLTVSDIKISHGEPFETNTPEDTTPPATTAPADTTPPATSAPAVTTPPATSAPAVTTPAATTAPAATDAPATTTPTNPETGSESNAMYVALLTISMLAIAALMIPEIRSKLIRK